MLEKEYFAPKIEKKWFDIWEETKPFKVDDRAIGIEGTSIYLQKGEILSARQLLYGLMLRSGNDASVALAYHCSKTISDFTTLMNETAKKAGATNTNFENPHGLDSKNHYTTAEDMAVIVREACKNELCHKILSTYQYTTAATPQHPVGIPLTSTLFSHMYGTEPEGADILGGKTGFVNESGYCIASFGKSDYGNEYVCITFKGAGLWPTVYDQFHLYERYAK